MKTALAVAAIAALVAAAAWALTSPKPADTPYTIEVRDVAGAKSFVVSPEVEVTASEPLLEEVVVASNTMPEVVVRPTAAIELAAFPAAGLEAVN